MKILLEMRPALDGHAGIPQETRLLFRGLNDLAGVSVDGLLQSSTRVLSPGLPARRWGRPSRRSTLSRDEQLNRLARVVVSIQQAPAALLPKRVSHAASLLVSGLSLAARRLVGASHELTYFEAEHFRDFIWRQLFAKTLEPRDIDAVVAAGYRVSRTPWGAMHRFGLLSRAMTGSASYPRLDTRGYDLFVAETPYPAQVTSGTRMLVRYHDAIPMLMPHTISDKAYHQASHYRALRANVQAGAYFSCVSESTRSDLLALFPELEARSSTIHNMISEWYFAEHSPPGRVPEILRTRRNMRIEGPREPLSCHPDGSAPLFLLMVSTIEPRKNHLNLLAAWERLRTEQRFAGLRLVIVGALGWESKQIIKKFKPWIERGELLLLEDVPADELRQLYRHAVLTVCPSLYEGFDFSGVEAMRSGGVVAASDIAVHREVYLDAAAFFSPYSAEDMALVMTSLLDSSSERDRLRHAGARVAERYMPKVILPQWATLLQRMAVPK